MLYFECIYPYLQLECIIINEISSKTARQFGAMAVRRGKLSHYSYVSYLASCPALLPGFVAGGSDISDIQMGT
jgi:hypothetical protein